MYKYMYVTKWHKVQILAHMHFDKYVYQFLSKSSSLTFISKFIGDYLANNGR